MNDCDLRFADFAGPVPEAAQSPDDAARLWLRIAGEHLRRRRLRRFRVTGSAFALTSCLVATAFWGSWHASHAQIDWQARAQALELQLDGIGTDTLASSPVGSDAGLRFSLARVDRDLQAAYDRHAPQSQLSPLWKRRSELLNTLLVARRGHLTRI